ncbi:MAG: DUF4231 domain-containing protein [Roseburia sp.]|nr:DUF4231 domain-containing protein [Roseburia sp.]
MRSYSYKNDMEFLEMADGYIISDYIRKSLFNSLEWYMTMYHKYNFRYHVSSMIGLILPTFIIVLNDLQDFQSLGIMCKIAISVISALVAIANGLGSLYKWHEKSVGYRRCIEKIKCEVVYYIAEIGAYSNPEMRDRNFLEKMERILLNENKGWAQTELQKLEDVLDKLPDDDGDADADVEDVPMDVISEDTPDDTSWGDAGEDDVIEDDIVENDMVEEVFSSEYEQKGEKANGRRQKNHSRHDRC